MPKTRIENDPPMAPLRGGLLLTGGQEQALTRHFLERISKADSSYQNGWLKTRDLAMAHYGNDVSNRKRPGSVFKMSNMTMNLPKRFSRITTARSHDELLTNEPLIKISVEGMDDSHEDVAAIQRYCAFKMEEAAIASAFREAIMLSTIRGETVVKSTWKTEKMRWFRMARVLVDDNGQIVTARDGNPVTDKDAIEQDEDGIFRLVRDPNVQLPTTPRWENRRVAFTRTMYDGIEAACIDHRDFICDTTASCVHKADFAGIRLGIPLDEVFGMLHPLDKNPLAQKFLKKITKANNGSEAGSASEEPEDRRGEEARPDEAVPSCKFVEVYARVTVSEDGRSDEIAALLDVENDQLMAYDYLANVSPTGRRPFRVVRMEPIPSRWYGMGFYELFSDRHRFCDLFLNRVNVAASLSGNIKLENPNATEEGLAGEPIEFGTDKTYRLRDGYTAEDVFKAIPIPNDSAPSKAMLDTMLQTTQLEAGIVSAGDSALSSMPSSGLATGIRSMDRIANALFKLVLFDFRGSFNAILNDLVPLILAQHDENDAIKLMGEEEAARLKRYRDVSILPYKVKLQLSATKDQDMIANLTQALEMLIRWGSLEPEARERLREIVVKIVSLMGVDNTEKALGAIVPPVLPPTDQAGGDPADLPPMPPAAPSQPEGVETTPADEEAQ